MPWSWKWHPAPVSLPGKSHRQRSLMGYSPWGILKSWVGLNTHIHTQIETFIDYVKAFDCVDHNKLWKILKRWEYQTIWPASWEMCMQVTKKQNWTWNNRLVPNRERSTSTRLLSPCLFIFYAEYFLRTSLVAQMVKRLSTIRQTQVRALGWEDPWRRKWQSTPVLLHGKSNGQRSLVGYSLWGRKESDTTERLSIPFYSMKSTSWEMLGWMKHKLESRLPGEMPITSDMQMTQPLWKKAKKN